VRASFRGTRPLRTRLFDQTFGLKRFPHGVDFERAHTPEVVDRLTRRIAHAGNAPGGRYGLCRDPVNLFAGERERCEVGGNDGNVGKIFMSFGTSFPMAS